jgi:hypothetical protein
MTHIKSALEIALERTEGVTGDPEKLAEDNMVKEGKRIASSFLSISEDTTETDMKEKLKAYSGKELKWVKEGVYQTLVANIVLPLDENYREKLNVISRGLPEIVPDKKRLSMIFDQLTKFFDQYLENKKAVRTQLEQQFAPRLRQREAQLSKQMGQNVRLNPMQDPEFANALQRNLGSLEERYQTALADLKNELRKMFEHSI